MTMTLGVGDGSGQLLVHGDYDSIKTAQRKLFQRAEALTALEAIAKDQIWPDTHNPADRMESAKSRAIIDFANAELKRIETP